MARFADTARSSKLKSEFRHLRCNLRGFFSSSPCLHQSRHFLPFDSPLLSGRLSHIHRFLVREHWHPRRRHNPSSRGRDTAARDDPTLPDIATPLASGWETMWWSLLSPTEVIFLDLLPQGSAGGYRKILKVPAVLVFVSVVGAGLWVGDLLADSVLLEMLLP